MYKLVSFSRLLLNHWLTILRSLRIAYRICSWSLSQLHYVSNTLPKKFHFPPSYFESFRIAPFTLSVRPSYFIYISDEADELSNLMGTGTNAEPQFQHYFVGRSISHLMDS